ncbi:recombinase family protein [Piscinibacter koreensis]|uniref:Recombinase family protein n=1 Tax=Piscinibacter koreensis TaxID=2742824 RepID=A0A7Y6NQV6_9BURK|nr:recombinase family protein [Schlegelella koreensis]NUZ07677.1 recombinase family protein [Schlegelella koreensis]
MNPSAHHAAQYVRMSIDKQDLSPAVQKEAIAAYAAARNLQIVATYEDEGRSGVHLKNRPGLMTLLRDVTEANQFSTVLVYDVSRWGRFQDTDAAAYYEYYCRLHGAEVVYVAEMFGPEVNPITAMLKSMRRAMAAEYSRDLANKSRAGQAQVITRGFQMGALPPLGYRRCSVSADGRRRVMLEAGQRKIAATDRIEWVLASTEEVELVKRICALYAHTCLSFADIARLGAIEGWRDHQGRALTGRGIATLVRNEALVGNFVWGRTGHKGRIVNCGPSRGDGTVPRVLDDHTWAQIQRRTHLELSRKQTDEQILRNLETALKRSPLLVTRDLRAQGLPGKATLRDRLGGLRECMRRVGQDPTELSRAISERTCERKADASAFGTALAERLKEAGHTVAYDGRLHVLMLPELKMRLRLLYSTLSPVGRVWRLRVDRLSRDVDLDLVVRMEARLRAIDFFLAPSPDVVVGFPPWLTEQVPIELTRFWCDSPEQLLDRISSLRQLRTAHGLDEATKTNPDMSQPAQATNTKDL